MVMPVMDIRQVIMEMDDTAMVVQVAVGNAFGNSVFVRMAMMFIIVCVNMFVIHRLVFVLVLVRFFEKQKCPENHKRNGNQKIQGRPVCEHDE